MHVLDVGNQVDCSILIIVDTSMLWLEAWLR
jgi:hypothetical protein